jgi:nitroimidazol reductase NimA-like FMN-containing flavoprotein (pyridoxamine 5'-phosphate oxidase superfamily)
MKTSFRLDPGDDWLDRNLAEQSMCRFATIGKAGPHVTPVGFVWVDKAAWICSQIRTQRFVDLQRDPRVALVIEQVGDPDTRYVEISGDAAVMGEVPCVTAETPEIERVEKRMVEKFQVPRRLFYDGLHAWVRITPRRVLRVTSVIAHHDDKEHLAAAAAAAEHELG